MTLYVRSQNKMALLKCETIYIEEFRTEYRIRTNEYGTLGKYDTKERCLEILDEIQSKMCNLPIIVDKVDNNYLENDAILLPNCEDKVIPINVLVYQMPEK